MSVLSTGQPDIWAAKLDAFDNIGTWFKLDVPKDGTTTLETSDGDTTEYLQEGGGKVDVDRKESSFSLTFDLFVKKGFRKPIDDKNGVVVDNYAIKLAPKDKKCYGFILYKCQVAANTSYSVADGMICRYTFTALQTDDHEQMMDFYVHEDNLETDVNFVNIPASGEDLTATVEATLGDGETLTALADTADTWISTSVSSDTVTITASGANTGARREGWVTLSAGTRSARIRVNQLAAAS